MPDICAIYTNAVDDREWRLSFETRAVVDEYVGGYLVRYSCSPGLPSLSPSSRVSIDHSMVANGSTDVVLLIVFLKEGSLFTLSRSLGLLAVSCPAETVK